MRAAVFYYGPLPTPDGFLHEEKESAQASAVIEETLEFLRKSLGD